MVEKLGLLAPLWSGTSFSEPTTCSRSALCTAAEVQIHLALKCELLFCYVLANIIKQVFTTSWFLYSSVCPFSSILSPLHISYRITTEHYSLTFDFVFGEYIKARIAVLGSEEGVCKKKGSGLEKNACTLVMRQKQPVVHSFLY